MDPNQQPNPQDCNARDKERCCNEWNSQRLLSRCQPCEGASSSEPSMRQHAHLSMRTVSATSRGRHCCCGTAFSTPAAGPTVTVYVRLSARLTRLQPREGPTSQHRQRIDIQVIQTRRMMCLKGHWEICIQQPVLLFCLCCVSAGNCLNFVYLHTIRCRASGESGAADE